MRPKSRNIFLTALAGVALAFELSAGVVARYDGGTAAGAPPVAPDQYLFHGRTWTALVQTNAEVTVGPLSPDPPSCLQGWNVSDNSPGPGRVIYSYPLDAPLHASASSNGWELTMVSRMVTNHNGGGASAFVQFGDINTQHRFLIYFNVFSSGTLSMQLVGTNGGIVGFAQGTNYHTHKLVYSPLTRTVKYFVDSQLVKSGWSGACDPATVDGPAFGTSSNAGQGSISFQRVEFGVEPPPPVATAIRSIQAGPFAERTALQWDAATHPGGTGLKEYVVYRNGLEVQRSPATSFVDVFLQPCQNYQFTVVAVDTNGTAYSPSLPFPVTSLPRVPVLGPRKVKVLLYNFPDFPSEPFTTNAANDLVFANPWSVNAYFQEVSYGRLTLQGDVAGWFTMPDSASNYCTFTLNGGLWYGCDNGRFIQDALRVLPPEHTNNLSTYQNFLLIFQGVGTVGIAAGQYKIFGATFGFRQDVIAHEMGHWLDLNSSPLMHAAGWSDCTAYPVGPDLLRPTATCPVGRYTDNFDVMGAGNSYHLSMYHKEMLGFLLPENIRTADQDGDYTLYAAEERTNAVQMIKIPLEHGMFYFLEYRTPRGFDGPGTPVQGTAPIDGVLLRLRVVLPPGTDGDTLRPDIILNPGTPFLDPYRGLRIEVTQKLGDYVILRVTGTEKPLKLTNLQRVGVDDQDVELSFDSVVGAKYFIQSTSNFVSWATAETNIVAGSASTTNVIAGEGGANQKFYRVGVDAVR